MDGLLSINGALALSGGGAHRSLVTTAGGAPCCCAGACVAYFRAPSCGNTNQCPLVPPAIYVCASAWLASGCPPVNRVISIGTLCYHVEDIGDPIPAKNLPAGAFTFDGPFECAPNCNNCTIPGGYYQLKFCACRDDQPGQAEFNAVIDCNCEWQNRAAGMRCPTYQLVASNGTVYCVQADIFGPPATPGPGAQILCAPSGDGCCECCNGFNHGSCGTFLCASYYADERRPTPVYGPSRRQCCGERFVRTGQYHYTQRIANPPLTADCTVREEFHTWAIDSGDPATWFITKRIIDRWPVSGCPVVADFTETEQRLPACDAQVTRVGITGFNVRGFRTFTCTDSGWDYLDETEAGALTTAGGLVRAVVRESFKVTLGVCGGPCERGGDAPFAALRQVVASATISPLPPLPLLGGLL